MLGTLLFLLVSVFLWVDLLSRRRRLPPGPFPVPIIGNLLHIVYGQYKYGGVVETMHVYKKQYGGVYTMWLGPIPTVNICEYGLAHETMIKDGNNYRDRFTPYVLLAARKDRGMTFTNGDYWMAHRRFTITTLRSFGLGRNIMEERIMEEFEKQFSRVDKQMGESGHVDTMVNSLMDMVVGSIVNRMLVGFGFDQANEREFFSLIHAVDAAFTEIGAFDMPLGKWSMKVPGLRERLSRLIKPQAAVVEFVKKQVDERLASISYGEHALCEPASDFVDAYLLEMEKERRETGDNRVFDITSLHVDLMDLWIAGMETTVLALQWGIIHLLKNPHVIEKCRQEVFSVTNRNRNISLSDKTSTPYLNATLNEINRMAAILNLNLWRRNEKAAVIGGYTVPAGTVMTAQTSVIMSDSQHFPDPQHFRPERYLEGDKSLEQRITLFGMGKRSCLGESLARAELYLIFANLFQRYDISCAPGYTPTTVPLDTVAFMNRPTPPKIRLTKLE